ncbi:acyltransferase family protein [Verrucomicrobia bacterium]|nr:acyltransferase family protein [Verrucomicrobiota bacterium]
MRYHGLDFLRAAMMLLGVALHTGVLYMPYPHGNDEALILTDALNPFRDIESYSLLAQRSVFLIHYFRMPAFMLLAGFFAALLVKNRGFGHLVKNRGQRILLPLIMFWFILWPMDNFSWAMGKAVMTYKNETASILTMIQNNFSWKHLPFFGASPHTMHLWFIHYLVIFYLVSVPFIYIFSTRLTGLSGIFKRITEFVFTSRLRFAIIPSLVMLSFLTLKNGNTFHFEVSFKFFPSISILLNFIVFFLAGWLFYTRREVVEHLKKNVWIYTPIAFFLLLAMLWAAETHIYYEKLLDENESSTDFLEKKTTYFNLATIIQAACVWFVIFSLIGLSEKLVVKSNPLISYFVDSSYWVYLIHRPLCTFFAALLIRWDASGEVKFFTVILIVSIICTVSYHYLVRNTWIGHLLNGRKKTREFPLFRNVC